MNKTAVALLVKLFMTFVAAIITFVLIDANPWTWVLGITVIATALNYGVGDLLVLPKFGNITASVGDGVLAALVFYIASLVTATITTTLTTLAIFAVLVAVAEYFFHRFLRQSEKVAP